MAIKDHGVSVRGQPSVLVGLGTATCKERVPVVAVQVPLKTAETKHSHEHQGRKGIDDPSPSGIGMRVGADRRRTRFTDLEAGDGGGNGDEEERKRRGQTSGDVGKGAPVGEIVSNRKRVYKEHGNSDCQRDRCELLAESKDARGAGQTCSSHDRKSGP